MTPRFIQLTTFYLGMSLQRVSEATVSNGQSQQLPKHLIISPPPPEQQYCVLKLSQQVSRQNKG
jgi:hypothetical protein